MYFQAPRDFLGFRDKPNGVVLLDECNVRLRDDGFLQVELNSQQEAELRARGHTPEAQAELRTAGTRVVDSVHDLVESLASRAEAFVELAEARRAGVVAAHEQAQAAASSDADSHSHDAAAPKKPMRRLAVELLSVEGKRAVHQPGGGGQHQQLTIAKLSCAHENAVMCAQCEARLAEKKCPCCRTPYHAAAVLVPRKDPEEELEDHE